MLGPTNGRERRSKKGLKTLSRTDDDATGLVIDQTRRRLRTHVGHGCFKRGEQAILEVSEQWEATKLLGALSEHGETRFSRCESNFNSDVTVHVLGALREEFGAHLIVVLDNGPDFTSKQVKDFADSVGIELCYVPRYSPHMIPVGECWRQLDLQLKNRLFEELDQFNRAIHEAHDEVNLSNMFNYLYPKAWSRRSFDWNSMATISRFPRTLRLPVRSTVRRWGFQSFAALVSVF